MSSFLLFPCTLASLASVFSSSRRNRDDASSRVVIWFTSSANVNSPSTPKSKSVSTGTASMSVEFPSVDDGSLRARRNSATTRGISAISE